MGLETDLTPYGSAVSFAAEGENPFKPVTYGHFCFSMLKIIDKLGQAVHAVSPSIHGTRKIPKLYISEYLRAQQLLLLPISDTSLEVGRDDADRRRGSSCGHRGSGYGAEAEGVESQAPGQQPGAVGVATAACGGYGGLPRVCPRREFRGCPSGSEAAA
ncbi:hypothetical protein F4782DRAFT_528942 [Xylaria castorea]|nr:hypothetical protein F4782DRAFT_528942 [Xylaria castorea]